MALKREYYAAQALSSSGIKKLKQSPAHFLAAKNTPHKSAKALILGELIHYHTLTPELMKSEIAIFTKGKSLESKKGFDFCMDNQDKFCCTQEHWDFADKVAERIWADPNVAAILKRKDVQNEYEIYTSINGVKCKALLDQICPDIILDVKTSSDDGAYFKKADGFVDKFFRLGYDIQGAWYQHMAMLQDNKLRDVWFLVVEMEEPFATKFVRPDQDCLDMAWDECEAMIPVYERCIRTGKYPAYPFDVETISVPAWKLKKYRKMQDKR